MLRDAGYWVHLAADTETALKTVHASAEPLIVILDASNTRFVNSILASRRLIYHHAYVLVTPEPLRLAPECLALYARLTLFIVHVPFTRDHLLQVMAQASRCLTAAYPAAPAARNEKYEAMASTGSTQAYRHSGADDEQPSDSDDRGLPP